MSDTPPQQDAPRQDAPGNDGYRVLARKYRPRTFEELVGQEALVRTLANAFESGRIAQGYMLTGVRGTGKTTTARLIARALNYSLSERPTVHMPEFGEHCAAIMEARHVDVMEMDAASHTSVNNIREIIDQVSYRPVAARYKVYIIDEVHMLSTSAFNALLKTLEEPPAHVKFIFATTEIRKVPITVISRCQRFDLRRVPAQTLKAHLARVCELEKVGAREEALGIIARVAEGSVRDALSLLDQAIAYGNGVVETAHVREMLGLADHGLVITLFTQVMKGDAGGALATLEEMHAAGANPYQVLADLAAFTHLITRMKVLGEAGVDFALAEEEREAGRKLAARIAMPALARAWQMLLKGMDEVQRAPLPLPAAEMVLIRLAHVAEAPPPEEILRRLDQTRREEGEAHSDGAARAATAPEAPRAARGGGGTAAQPLTETDTRPDEHDLPRTLADIALLAENRRDLRLAGLVKRFVRPVEVAPGRLRIGLVAGAPRELPQQLAARLGEWTGRRWAVLLEPEAETPTLAEQERRRQDELLARAQEHPQVRALLQAFPRARVLKVRAGHEGTRDDEDGTS